LTDRNFYPPAAGKTITTPTHKFALELLRSALNARSSRALNASANTPMDTVKDRVELRRLGAFSMFAGEGLLRQRGRILFGAPCEVNGFFRAFLRFFQRPSWRPGGVATSAAEADSLQEPPGGQECFSIFFEGFVAARNPFVLRLLPSETKRRGRAISPISPSNGSSG
jgi:hypothetical protein